MIDPVLLLAEIRGIQLMYCIPLIIAISVVYGATRHEFLAEITFHAIRAAIWVIGFMLVIFALVWWASRGL